MILKTAKSVTEAVLVKLNMEYKLLAKSESKVTFYVYDLWLENQKMYIDIYNNEYIITLKERYATPCIRVTFKTQSELAIELTRDIIYYWSGSKKLCTK